jgi:hypothetical protein
MVQLFQDLCNEAYGRNGVRGLAGLWVQVLADTLRSAGSERASAVKNGSITAIKTNAAWLYAVVILFPVLVLQAWDSKVLESSPLVMLLVALAIGFPIAAMLLSSRAGVLGVAFGVSCSLLLVARLISPVPLPDLFVILPPLGVFLYWHHQQKRNSTRSA